MFDTAGSTLVTTGLLLLAFVAGASLAIYFMQRRFDSEVAAELEYYGIDPNAEREPVNPLMTNYEPGWDYSHEDTGERYYGELSDDTVTVDVIPDEQVRVVPEPVYAALPLPAEHFPSETAVDTQEFEAITFELRRNFSAIRENVEDWYVTTQEMAAITG
jgi:hypothetical protein